MGDYVTKTELVTFETTSVQKSFQIDIGDDNIVEAIEQFGVRATSNDPKVNIDSGDLRISIRDNDRK